MKYKTKWIQIRVSNDEKKLITKLAKLDGTTVSKYLLEMALKEARKNKLV
jgi:uncharacterized protein (DUF1778 family)